MNIIVTGASRGIGWELVQLFAQNTENKIFALSRNKNRLNELADLCKNNMQNSQVLPISIDINDLQSIAPTINGQIPSNEHIDIVIHNAGYLVAKPFSELSITEVENMYRVNVTGPFELTRALLPNLKLAKQPHVVNISSMGGFQGSVKFPGLTAYASSKAAIAGLTECLAEELKETRIKVNCMQLSLVNTL